MAVIPESLISELLVTLSESQIMHTYLGNDQRLFWVSNYQFLCAVLLVYYCKCTSCNSVITAIGHYWVSALGQ